MSALRELQTHFAAAVFSGPSATEKLLAHCDDSRGLARRGIEAYRSSVLANLAGAVQATYPVVEAIVGKAFLVAAVHRYVETSPSLCGDLNAYGGDFDVFLAAYEAAASLPYLPAVARLEWQVQQVYAAADAPPQQLSRLATTAPEDWGGLRFDLDPAHAVLAADWPLARLWEVNQPGYEGDFAVDFHQAQTVLIQRQPQGIAVTALAAGDEALLKALAAGKTLADAVDEAAASADFDLSTSLQIHMASGLLRRAF